MRRFPPSTRRNCSSTPDTLSKISDLEPSQDERDLLILDEPSSGLDAEAEYEIHQTLRSYRRTRTSLLISHRLGAIRDADLLVVLDQGRVIEQGTHAELIAAGGIYANLFGKQAANYQHPEQPAQWDEAPQWSAM